VLAPVDLSAASSHQIGVAAGIAQALSVPLLIAHVVEPVVIPMRVRRAMAGADAARRAAAGDRLAAAAHAIPDAVKHETMILSGDPSEEIVKLVDTRGAHLIVMGLHSSEPFGPRMGATTYRVLSLTRALVLALPPAPPK
jgi:nucleotide-binding universal stress UspA family protein